MKNMVLLFLMPSKKIQRNCLVRMKPEVLWEKAYYHQLKEVVDMLKRTVLLLCFLPLCISCSEMSAGYSKTILKHPQTLDFQFCEKTSGKNKEECVKEYQSKGYEIWSER